jgi:hypothetical protein
MKNIIEHYDSTTSMTKKFFLCVLGGFTDPKMMTIAKRHASIMVELAICYKIVMKGKLTSGNLKQIGFLDLRLISFIN